jgi:PIN domain nuclease of toxin-antitoxin system
MAFPVVPWELAIKVKAGKLTLPQPPLDYVMSLARRYHLTLSPVGLDAALLCAAADLPLIHRDPFDRILIATAIRESLTLLTSDRTIPTYPNPGTPRPKLAPNEPPSIQK